MSSLQASDSQYLDFCKCYADINPENDINAEKFSKIKELENQIEALKSDVAYTRYVYDTIVSADEAINIIQEILPHFEGKIEVVDSGFSLQIIASKKILSETQFEDLILPKISSRQVYDEYPTGTHRRNRNYTFN